MQDKISLMAAQAKTVFEMAKSQTSPAVSRIKRQNEMNDFDLSQSVPEEMLFNQSTGMMGNLAEDRKHHNLATEEIKMEETPVTNDNPVNRNSMAAGGTNTVAFDSNPVVNMSSASVDFNTIDTQANTIDLQADKFVESEMSVPQVEPIAVPIIPKKSTANQTKVFNTVPKV